jgi:anti-sigma B factor antagonist
MTEVKVTMNVRKVAPTTCVVDIRGEITSAAENMLMDAYTQATTLGATNILLNFSDLEYMNSSGIGLLVTLLIRTRRQQHRLLALGLSDHYRQIFELTRLNDAISIYADEEQALRALITMNA